MFPLFAGHQIYRSIYPYTKECYSMGNLFYFIPVGV